MDKLQENWNAAASIGLAIALPCIIYKVTKTITLRKSCNSLSCKVVVITGASGGIGEAIAHQFHKNGCRVVLCARRHAELERVANDLLKINPQKAQPIVHPLDLSEISSLQGHVDEILEKTGGKIDILVNNGGILHKGPVSSTELEVHTRVMAVNYFGAVALTKAALPAMVKNKSGQVVFISSVAGLIATPYRSAYCASKHAMQAFADSLRAEVAADNIDVTVVSPGYVKTDISQNSLTPSGENFGELDPVIESGYSAEYLAKAVLRTVALRGKELIFCTPIVHFAVCLRKYFPSLYFLAMEYRARTNN